MGPFLFIAGVSLAAGLMLWFLVQNKPLAAIAFMVFGLWSIGSCLDSLGRAKPIRMESANLIGDQILAYQFHEGIDIEFLLKTVTGDRLYSMPWDEKIASSLLKAGEKAKAEHRHLLFGMKFGPPSPGGNGSLDQERGMFYVAPLEALPDKEGDE